MAVRQMRAMMRAAATPTTLNSTLATMAAPGAAIHAVRCTEARSNASTG